MQNDSKLLKFVAELNSKIKCESLFLPLPDGFEIKEKDDRRFVAVKNNILIQFLTDGVLDKEESLANHIKKVLLENESSNILNQVRYIKSHQCGTLYFEIYCQDILVGSQKFIRQINAYFINELTNEFCQLSIACGQYNVSNYPLLNTITDLENDPLLRELLVFTINYLDKITYKDV